MSSEYDTVIYDYGIFRRFNPNVSEPQLRDEYYVQKNKAERMAREIGAKITDVDVFLRTALKQNAEMKLDELTQDFMELPRDLISAKIKNLGCIPLYNQKNILLPYYISFIDETSVNAAFEELYSAYKLDCEECVADNLIEARLNEETSSEIRRMIKLSLKLADYLEVSEETRAQVRRCAQFSKYDTVTRLYKQFSAVNGVVGKELALCSGEDKLITNALCEQYMPNLYYPNYPESTTGAIISIADKLDLLVGAFACGKEFTMQHAQMMSDIIQIVIAKDWDVNIFGLIDYSLYTYIEENTTVFIREEVMAEIRKRFDETVSYIMRAIQIDEDAITNVLSSDSISVYEAFMSAGTHCSHCD